MSFYPAKTLANYMMISYERQVSKKNVFKTAIGYSYFQESENSLDFKYDLKNYSAVRFDLAYKYFVGKESVVFNGFYISPYLSIKNSNFEYRSYVENTNKYSFVKGSANCVTTGFILGLNMPLGESFNADVYVGNALITSRGDYKQASRASDAYRNSISFITCLSIGFGF